MQNENGPTPEQHFNEVLSNEQALKLTKSIIDKIDKLKGSLRIKAFFAWQGIITALTMQIDADNAIKQIDLKIKLLNGDMVSLVALKTQHEKIKVEAEFNYQCYNEWLLANGINV